MTQKEKELLLKDLCGRLPYGVICEISNDKTHIVESLKVGGLSSFIQGKVDIKPYLRRIDDLTEKEERKLRKTFEEMFDFSFRVEELLEEVRIQKRFPVSTIDYLNSIYVDYRGMIDMKLAIEVTKDNNPYKTK